MKTAAQILLYKIIKKKINRKKTKILCIIFYFSQKQTTKAIEEEKIVTSPEAKNEYSSDVVSSRGDRTIHVFRSTRSFLGVHSTSALNISAKSSKKKY